MNNLYQQESISLIKIRIEQLDHNSKPLWGKMNVAQMLAHCAKAMDMASGKINPPRRLVGRVIGPLFKTIYYNHKLFNKDSPTDDMIEVTDARIFNDERTNLLSCIDFFYQMGEEQCTSHPHPFFGKFTPQQWASGMYKHLDHHLRQFGV
jgi:hypothetical protein